MGLMYGSCIAFMVQLTFHHCKLVLVYDVMLSLGRHLDLPEHIIIVPYILIQNLEVDMKNFQINLRSEACYQHF